MSERILDGLKPERPLYYFEEICKIRDAKWAQMRKHWNCK